MPEVEGESVDFFAAPYSVYSYSSESTETKTITYNVTDGLVVIGPSSCVVGSNLYSVTLYRSKSISITKATIKIGETTSDLDVSNLNWQDDFVTFSLGYKSATDNVVITIEGKEVSSHSLTIVGADYITYYNGAPNSKYLEGETVDFSFGFADGYNVSYTIDGATNAASYNANQHINFVMPGNDVTITFVGTEYGTIEVASNEHITSTKLYSASGSYGSATEMTSTSAAAGSDVYVIPEVESGYVLGKAYIQGDEENKVSPADISLGYDSSWNKITKTGYEFTMPSDGSSITIVIETAVGGTITITEDETHYSECVVRASNSISASVKSLTDFAPGAEFYLFPTTNSGFALTGATVSDGTNSTHSDAQSGSGYVGYNSVTYQYVKCVMPENGIANVTLEFGTTYSVTIENEASLQSQVRFSFDGNATSFAAGDTVKVTISETYGYSLTKLEYGVASSSEKTELEIKKDEYSRKYVEFVMPEENVTLTPSITESQKVDVKFEYVNNSSNELGMVKVAAVKGYSASLSTYSCAAGASDSATNSIYVGDTISVSVSDYSAYDSSTYSYTQRFDVKVEVSYSDGTDAQTLDVPFSYGSYSLSTIEVTSNLAGVKLVIADKAA